MLRKLEEVISGIRSSAAPSLGARAVMRWLSGYLRGRVWCLSAGIYGLRAFIIGLLFCDMQSLKFQFS